MGAECQLDAGFLGSARQQVLGVFRLDREAAEGSPMQCAYTVFSQSLRGHHPRDAIVIADLTGSTASSEPAADRNQRTWGVQLAARVPRSFASVGTAEARRTTI
jgi:hypothetical protein